MNVKAETFDAALLESLRKSEDLLPRREPGYGITASEYFDQSGNKFRQEHQAKVLLDTRVKDGILKVEKMLWDGKRVSVYTKK